MPIPILSFFTGAGFLDIGFCRPSFDTIWWNETNLTFAEGFVYAMAVLTGNPQDDEAHICPLQQISSEDIARAAFGGFEPPDVWGMIGGPPCQDFSIAGSQGGHEGERGSLTRLYLERVADLRPTFFVMENVPGLLRTKKHREPFMEIIRREIWPQYDATMGIYNALDYGVPQDRERLIVVGRLKSATERGLLAPWKIPPPLFPSAKFGYPWPTEVVPAGEVPEKPDLCPEELMAGTHICGDLSGLSNGTESFRPKSDKFGTILEGDVSRKSFKKLHRFRFSPTACYGNNEVHLHPVEPRRLTVREALRLQSVPDGYALPPEMSLTDKFKMIGNGVPVRLASAVADSIAEMIG